PRVYRTRGVYSYGKQLKPEPSVRYRSGWTCPNDSIFALGTCGQNGLPSASMDQPCGGDCRLLVIRCSADDEGAGYYPGPDIVCSAIRASRYAVAVGVPAVDKRVSAEDHAGELRLHGQISALRLQLVGSQPLPPDEGVLPSRLRANATVCRQRTVVSGRVVSGGRGREPSQRGRHFPPDSVWQ